VEPLRGVSILVADDDETYRAIARIILEQAGCSIDVARDGREAVQRFRTRSYDLILIDCQMPRMDGYEATRLIREQQAAGPVRTPILAVTASLFDGDPRCCCDAGMNDLLRKPFAPRELIGRCLRLLHAPQNGTAWVSASPLQFTIGVEGVRPSVLRKIIGMFLEEGPAMLHRLMTALRNGDLSEAAKAAHRMRGGAVRGMMPVLERTLADLERACRGEARIDELPLERIVKEFEAARSAALEFLTKENLNQVR
jgi:CheY-like chemotaxis protein